MSKKIVEYKDLIAFHPGQYVGELIEDYNVTQKEFAERLGVSAKTVSKLVNAEESISKETAQAFQAKRSFHANLAQSSKCL